MQESPSLKSGWLAENKPLSWKKPNISLYKSFSKILLQTGSKDTARWFFKVCLSPFYWIGIILTFFHSHWYIPLSMQWLKLSLNGLQMEVLHMFIMQILILLWPCALFGPSFAVIISMASFFRLFVVQIQNATLEGSHYQLLKKCFLEIFRKVPNKCQLLPSLMSISLELYK